MLLRNTRQRLTGSNKCIMMLADRWKFVQQNTTDITVNNHTIYCAVISCKANLLSAFYAINVSGLENKYDHVIDLSFVQASHSEHKQLITGCFCYNWFCWIRKLFNSCSRFVFSTACEYVYVRLGWVLQSRIFEYCWTKIATCRMPFLSLTASKH